MLTHLSHMRNIKERCLSFGSAPQMFLHDTAIVTFKKYWKFISSEGNHVTSQFLVKIVEGSLDEIFVRRKRTFCRLLEGTANATSEGSD